MAELSGSLEGTGLRIGIVVGRFNSSITEQLLAGAIDRLVRGGVKRDDIDIYWAPGSFELPQVAERLVRSEKYDGILPLGCLIRGETTHFEYLAAAVTRELAHLSLAGTPLVFGVLTTDTTEQAVERSGMKLHKGVQAAESLLELIDLLRQI
jgi:6,7-dimethyl-8-ribityllumazine synthase